MMAACDTFCSEAVEQLRTHARRLQIPILEKGYEKDHAIVAKEAIQEATRTGQTLFLLTQLVRCSFKGNKTIYNIVFFL
ncbi:putative signal-recognition-particle GTPase [Helianthus annuus]|uniref:Signal-recognition-particle GTPase n=1 Tax=Helianthus annuus TaxID=4232 RepID=A0A9K3EM43_HELAN|nr:putative signal-recognition-particle GTPase [Helianthus annuus]KAJ0477823.1 putative signal-recognition-particle GTPase [Helianthus annuus]KAJ0482410.1 putative signal-recognition-particle GTPase [Helianthus annuus]KAJ0498655.1 putative signal-recognition-particle GTPase [Helianthus annuus]KAJ0664668.1 putative signal-recognition-particle GTPase [Helianthus annuus]